MPLTKSGSRQAISHNIQEMRASGHPEDQSVAAAMRIADQYKAKGGKVAGPLLGATGGREDKLPISVPDHSHVIPADVVSALGQGNTLRGMHVLSQMFPPEKSLKSGGPAAKIMASDGEFVVTPENVKREGKGDMEHGHAVLDHFILRVRNQNIHALKNMPGPSKD